MPPIKRIRIAQPKPDPITTGKGWLLSKIDELEASLKDYVIASGLVLRYHADLLQQQQTKNEFSARSAQPPKELLERIQQNNYAWIRAELDEYLRLAQTPEQVPDNPTSSATNDQVDSSFSSVPPTATATVIPSSSSTSTSTSTATVASAASISTAQPTSETVSRPPVTVKNPPTGEHTIPAQPPSQQAMPPKPADQSSTPSLTSATPSAPGPIPAPFTVAAAVAAASSTNDNTSINNDRDNDTKSTPVLSFNPQNPHFPRPLSTLPGSSMSMTEEQPSPVPFVTKPRPKPKPRMKPLLGTIEIETEDEMRTSGLGGIRTSSIVDPLLGVVDDSLVQPNMIITPGGGTTRPDGSSTSNPTTFFPPPPLPPPLSAPPAPRLATATIPSSSSSSLSSSTSLLQPPPPLLPSTASSSSSAQTQMPMQLPVQMQGFPQTLTAAEIDQMTSEQAQAIMDQLNAAVSASTSTSASTSAPASAPIGQPQPQSQPQLQSQQPPMSLPIPPMEGVIDLTGESDEPHLTSTAMNTTTNTNNDINASNSANAGTDSINMETGDMTDLSEFLNDVDGENWQQILNQFGQS